MNIKTTLTMIFGSLLTLAACDQSQLVNSDNNNDLLIDPLGSPFECPQTHLLVGGHSESSQILITQIGETQESSPPQQVMSELNTLDLGAEVQSIEKDGDQLVVATADQKIHLLEITNTGSLKNDRVFETEGELVHLKVALPLIVFQNSGEERIRVWDTSDPNMTSGGYLIESVGELVDLEVYAGDFGTSGNSARQIYAAVGDSIKVYSFPDNSGSLIKEIQISASVADISLSVFREDDTSGSNDQVQAISIKRWPLLYVLNENDQVQSLRLNASGTPTTIESFEVSEAQRLSSLSIGSIHRNLFVETSTALKKFVTDSSTGQLAEVASAALEFEPAELLRFGEFLYLTDGSEQIESLYSGNLIDPGLEPTTGASFSLPVEKIQSLSVFDERGC